MASQLQPGMHAGVERLSGGRFRINWRLVGWQDVSTLGAFEGSERDVLALLARWKADRPRSVHFDPGDAE